MDRQEYELRRDVLREWHRRATLQAWTMEIQRRMVEVARPLVSYELKRHIEKQAEVVRLLDLGHSRLVKYNLQPWWDAPTRLPQQWKEIYNTIDTLTTPPPAESIVDQAIISAASYWTSHIGLYRCRHSKDTENGCKPPL